MKSSAITLARRVLREYHDIPTFRDMYTALSDDRRDLEGLSRAVVRDRGDAVLEADTALQRVRELLRDVVDDLTRGQVSPETAHARAAVQAEAIVAGAVEHGRELGYALGVAVGASWRQTMGVPHV